MAAEKFLYRIHRTFIWSVSNKYSPNYYRPMLSLKSVLISPSHLHLGLPNSFPTKILYAFSIIEWVPRIHPFHSPWFTLPYLTLACLALPYQLALQPFVGLGFLRQWPRNKIGSDFTYKCDFPFHLLPVGSDWFAWVHLSEAVLQVFELICFTWWSS
jgi:hypothetical protein